MKKEEKKKKRKTTVKGLLAMYFERLHPSECLSRCIVCARPKLSTTRLRQLEKNGKIQ